MQEVRHVFAPLSGLRHRGFRRMNFPGRSFELIRSEDFFLDTLFFHDKQEYSDIQWMNLPDSGRRVFFFEIIPER
jgi:hypothetical protein